MKNIKEIKTLAIICNANEIRSRIIESLFRQNFPHIEIRSYGININLGRNKNPGFFYLMNDWGIDIQDRVPKDFTTNLSFVSTADLVIASDSFVYSKVLPFNTETENLVDYAIDENHIPVDPINMSEIDFRKNLAKLIHCTFRLINKLSPIYAFQSKITALIPQLEKDFFRREPNSFIIDARFIKRATDSRLPERTYFFEEDELLNGKILMFAAKEIETYRAKNEFLQPEKVLISNNWVKFIGKIAEHGPTTIICEPITTQNLPLWKAYLTSSVADVLIYL